MTAVGHLACPGGTISRHGEDVASITRAPIIEVNHPLVDGNARCRDADRYGPDDAAGEVKGLDVEQLALRLQLGPSNPVLVHIGKWSTQARRGLRIRSYGALPASI